MDNIVNYAQKLSSSISSSIRVCMPGTIESYDYIKQKASIKISMKELYNNGKELDYPIVEDVPVITTSSGGASITLPINRGDTCLVLFNDRDITNWLLGGVGQKPDSTRMHNLSDAIAIMGLSPFTKKGGATNNEDVQINYSEASISITKSGEINITTTKTVNVKSVEVINIESKNVNIKSSETVSIDSKNLTLNASETITTTCKNAALTVTEGIIAKSKNLTLNIEESSIITSKNLTLNATETITTTCKDAVLTASGEIKSSATKFTHTGDIVITGNLELSGTSALKGQVTTSAGIVNTSSTIRSGTVILDTHIHSYLEPVVGSTPTAAIPGLTGTPT